MISCNIHVLRHTFLMNTIQVKIDEALLREVDRTAARQGLTLSVFTQQALRQALACDLEKQLEEKHREGYRKNPVSQDEFGSWSNHKLPTERPILDSLVSNLEIILGRIDQRELRRYDFLQTTFRVRNVASDNEFQRTFNGFYRMRSRKRDFYTHFFAMLEREKHNKSISFDYVLENIFAQTNRIEPSFSSKLIATIRPELPVYDKFVALNLSLNVPAQHRPAKERLHALMKMYAGLKKTASSLIGHPIFINQLRPAFDKAHPAFTHLADVKKLDLLLWQLR